MSVGWGGVLEDSPERADCCTVNVVTKNDVRIKVAEPNARVCASGFEFRILHGLAVRMPCETIDPSAARSPGSRNINTICRAYAGIADKSVTARCDGQVVFAFNSVGSRCQVEFVLKQKFARVATIVACQPRTRAEPS